MINNGPFNYLKMKNRESNIELLRIVLMIMIITHHIIVHGFGLENMVNDFFHHDKNKLYFGLFINSFVIVGVNTFVFISGYYGVKFKLKVLVSILFQALFYSLFISLLFAVFNHSMFDWEDLVRSIFPISGNVWWYLGVYLALYFISPFLNKGVDGIENKQLMFLLLGLLYLDCFAGFIFKTVSGDGFTIFHFITIYILARFLRKINIIIKKPIRFFLVSALVLFCGTLFFVDIHKFAFVWRLFSYNNPLLIFAAIMLFFTFKNIKVQSNFINLISSAVFGIYLIHEHPLIRKEIAHFISQVRGKESLSLLMLHIVCTIATIFTIGSLIELSRKAIFTKIEDKFSLTWQKNSVIVDVKKQCYSLINRLKITKPTT